MKKTKMLLGGVLLLSTLAISAVGATNNGVNVLKTANDVSSLQVKAGEPFSNIDTTIEDATDGVYVNLTANFDAEAIKAKGADINTVKLKISHKKGDHDEVLREPVVVEGNKITARVNVSTLTHIGDWYEFRLVDDKDVELRFFNGDDIPAKPVYFYNKASKKFFRLFEAWGAKMQFFEAAITHLDYVSKDNKVFARFTGVNNGNATGAVELSQGNIKKKTPFTVNKETETMEALVDVTEFPNNEKIKIDVVDTVGMLGGELQANGSGNNGNATPFFEEKPTDVISVNGVIYNYKNDGGNWYKLNKSEDLMNVTDLTLVGPNKVHVKGAVNSKINDKDLYLGLCEQGKNHENIFTSVKLERNAVGAFETTIEYDFTSHMTDKTIELQLFEMRGGKVTAVDFNGTQTIGAFDEYLAWKFHEQKQVVGDVLIKARHGDAWRVGFHMEKSWEATKDFVNCALKAEVGFTYKFSGSKIGEEIYTFDSARMYLDFEAPDYIKNAKMQDEYGVLVTSDLSVNLGEGELPSTVITSAYVEEKANVKGNWTVKLDNVNLETSIKKEIRFAPYFKMGTKYYIGKWTQASFYSTLEAQALKEQNVVNKKTMDALLNKYKA